MALAEIGSWSDVELGHLFYAYRKAKADCYFERSICIAQQFAEYEASLPGHLAALAARLKAGEVDDLLQEGLAEPRVVAKKLGIARKPQVGKLSNGHGFFSDPNRAFDWLRRTHALSPEFRLVGDFTVQMHVLSALWVNHVGHKFDAQLDSTAYGSRLRRYRPAADAPKGTVGAYHTEAIGSFQPYFAPYKSWREQGLNSIRRELEADRGVVAVSMDLTSYYHRIDACFLSDEAFHRDIGLRLTPWELSFTKSFVRALNLWAEKVAFSLKRLGCSGRDAKLGGLPIGLSMARVAANVLLRGFDRDITNGLAPIYYGRYVDDIFMVLPDPGHLTSAEELLGFVSARTAYFPQKASSSGEIKLKHPGTYWGRTSLVLQQNKQKVFFLEGRGGLDLLDNIESQIRSVSSERRLMPAPNRLERMASAQVLTAAASASEEADTLRRADGLSVRRLGWSIQLRAVETLARDLRAPDWRKEREQFYAFAHNHVLRPDRILDHVDYLPRLLSLAVALMDWAHARRMVDAAQSAIELLKENTASATMKVNGLAATTGASSLWEQLQVSLRRLSADAVARSLRWSSSLGGLRPLPAPALALCELLGLGSNVQEIERISLLLRESDWAKVPYKDHVRRDAKRQRPAVDREEWLHGLYAHESDLREYLQLTEVAGNASSVARIGPHCAKSVDGESNSLIPYLAPTRPYTTQEISLFLPDVCVFGDAVQSGPTAWARFVRAVRGIWVWAVDTESVQDAHTSYGGSGSPGSPRIAYIGRRRESVAPRLGISSLLTTEQSFRHAASGRSDLSPERYQRIKTIVDQAIQAKPRPTHLLLPELAIPERWIDTVAGRLKDAGISLISGVDYHVRGSTILSEAVLVLSDDRLGFPSFVQIRQAKSLPAAGEEQQLLSVFGKTWHPGLTEATKPVYVHEGFAFGILVCSELQNISHRQRFQGAVDCVMVLSWNQDLETFSALVESASLDVHAHIALVNNRRYGDSRVRVPAKANYKRDLCRLRGGENEHLVVVQLEASSLRAFQSRAKRWPRDEDPFKPVPEGFEIEGYRKTTPE